MYRPDVLAYAYRVCHANGGAPGVDGQTFEDIEAYGGTRWLDELMTGLREKGVDNLSGVISSSGNSRTSADQFETATVLRQPSLCP